MAAVCLRVKIFFFLGGGGGSIFKTRLKCNKEVSVDFVCWKKQCQGS